MKLSQILILKKRRFQFRSKSIRKFINKINTNSSEILQKQLDRIVNVELKKLQEEKHENDRRVLIVSHKIKTIQAINECKILSEFLKTDTEPVLFWKPSPTLSASAVPKSIMNAQKEIKEHYQEKSNKIKQEKYDELKLKLEKLGDLSKDEA